MSINNALPGELERRAKTFCSDPHFTDAVWKVLNGYHDLRAMELMEVTVDDARHQLTTIQTAIANLKGAVNQHKDLFPIPIQLSQDIKKIENHYKAQVASLDALQGRQSRNKSLRWLVGSLANIFRSYEVSDRHLVGFIEQAIPVISPATETALPSRRTIHTAKKEKCS